MLLLFLLIFSLFMLSLVRLSAFEICSDVVKKAHSICLQGLPNSSTPSPELKALVCAESFSSLSDSKIYISSGLIHLFVVSGAHLLIIEKILTRFLPRSLLLKLALMSLYALACGLNPPVTRALFAAYLSAFLSEKNIHWPGDYRVLVCGFLCLTFNPLWITSMSLQMSWLAALLTSGLSHLFTQSSAFFRQILFYIFFFPILVFAQIPGPLTILMNLLLAPALEYVLFPLGLLTWFFNDLFLLFNITVRALRSILTLSGSDINFQTAHRPTQLILLNWIFILTLHVCIHAMSVYKKRKLAI